MDTTTILNAPPPAITVIPAAYVLHWYDTRCANCGSISRRSDFYAMTYIRSRMDKGIARQLTRCDAPTYNVPVECVAVKGRTTPYCHACPPIDLSHLPPPPHAAHLVDLPGPALHDSLRPAAQRTKSTPKPTVKLSLKDIA